MPSPFIIPVSFVDPHAIEYQSMMLPKTRLGTCGEIRVESYMVRYIRRWWNCKTNQNPTLVKHGKQWNYTV